jgi:hypothetical protein
VRSVIKKSSELEMKQRDSTRLARHRTIKAHREASSAGRTEYGLAIGGGRGSATSALTL